MGQPLTRAAVLVVALLAVAPSAQSQALGRDVAASRLMALERQSAAYVPPPEYVTWWAEVVKDCGCTPAVKFSDVWWRRVNKQTFDCAVHDGCRGSYWPDVEGVFIAAPHTGHAYIVKHEMLHAVLGGDPNHSNAAWKHDVVMREMGNE